MQVLHGNRMAGKWLLGSLAVWAGVPTAPSVLIERSRGDDICQGAAEAESQAEGRHPTRAVCVESRAEQLKFNPNFVLLSRENAVQF